VGQYQYKFVRLRRGYFGGGGEAEGDYRRVIQEHARDGWRLVQLFAPAVSGSGKAQFYEVILEREVETRP